MDRCDRATPGLKISGIILEPGDEAPVQQTVHIVDDEAGMRAFVSFALRNAGYLTQIHASGREFLEALESGGARGCALLDVRMPDMGGLEVLSELARRDCGMTVIMMTGSGDVGTAVAAMKAGAIDFIEKPFHKEHLLDAVAKAVARRSQEQDRAESRATALACIAKLAPRELEVLQGVLGGMSNKAIGRHLGLSPRTVETYRANAMTRLNAASTADALRMAISAGIEPVVAISPAPARKIA